jgi:ribosomal protein S18 acetylase RimI-like enzyme
LYAAAYPGNFFVPRMLETGYYFGIRRGGMLASVAGVHVFSRPYKVAALGNITTRPDFRGQGLATAATVRLCQELRGAGIEHIGLNVKADNQAALECYKRIGFKQIADYGEYTMNAKGLAAGHSRPIPSLHRGNRPGPAAVVLWRTFACRIFRASAGHRYKAAPAGARQ